MHRLLFLDTVRRLETGSFPACGASLTVRSDKKLKRSPVLLAGYLALSLAACAEGTGPVAIGSVEKRSAPSAAIQVSASDTEATSMIMRTGVPKVDRPATPTVAKRKSNYAVAF